MVKSKRLHTLEAPVGRGLSFNLASFEKMLMLMYSQQPVVKSVEL